VKILTPLLPKEKFGCFVGIAESIVDAMIYKVLMDVLRRLFI